MLEVKKYTVYIKRLHKEATLKSWYSYEKFKL